MKFGMYIMAPAPISTAYFINPFPQSVYVYSSVVRQLFGKSVTAAMNTHAIIEELLDLSFSIWSVSYQRKLGNYVFPELHVYFLRWLFNDDVSIGTI
jgi:hypothetical protein